MARLAAGALFVDRENILLVHKTYGHSWDIPGGYVDRGESPLSACEREIFEEIGLKRSADRLLVQDWAPNEDEGDKILYVFGCGEIGEDASRLRLDGVEVDRAEWVAIGDVAGFVIPRLARRLTSAYRAHTSGEFLYLEHGKPKP
jgi:ADP-ribose pyrophosphatase YjhB (NUDIX family)